MIGNDWHNIIFNSSISFADRFDAVYRYQIQANTIYKNFSAVFGLNENSEITPESAPLLPIRAFQIETLYTADHDYELIFKSSGTSGMQRSTHYIADKRLYERAIIQGFSEHFPLSEYSILCYMPGYSDNQYSSLIWMANYLIKKDNSGLSRFLDQSVKLDNWIEKVDELGRKPILFGAAFGLLDILKNTNYIKSKPFEIIETGGMKTYRREISKAELRKILSEGYGIEQSSIHSEYGMCELLSQMYSIGGEWFTTPHWMEVTIRNPDNPQEICKPGEEGKIGIIDLANVYSCPFLLTEDKGVMDQEGKFKVLGRWNSDDLRGCNFLIDRD